MNGSKPTSEEMKVMRQPPWLLKQRTKEIELVLKGESHALDNFRDSACVVVVGTGRFLHVWWVRPYSVGFGRDRTCDQALSRPKSRLSEER
jgi:hypothetical protein